MPSPDLPSLTASIPAQASLSTSEAAAAAHQLTDPGVEADTKRAFLLALAERGESPAEVAAFAGVFRGLAREPELGEWASEAIDIVGTGGDRSGSFNLSTTSAFLLAAAGIPVIKHGNRSITSRSGSADLAEAIGFDLQADNSTLARNLKDFHFCFLFAPAFHPAFKEIMPVRKALAAEGHRTIFNLLGPLINPAQPAHLLMGVFANQWVDPVAEALEKIALRAGAVTHCLTPEGSGLDELTTAGKNHLRGIGGARGLSGTYSAQDLGFTLSSREELRGGEVGDNLLLLRQLAEGEAPGGLRDSVALNAGVALCILGKAPSIAEGCRSAGQWIKDGILRDWLKTVSAALGGSY